MSPIAPDGQPQGTSRRQLLRTGGLGVATTAFLAACTHARKKHPAPPGRSGTPTSTTLVAPTVPTIPPTADQLDEDITLLRTGSSLELEAALLYQTYGPKLSDATWSAAAARFATDHTAIAESFIAATPAKKQVKKPNDWYQTNEVDPISDTLSTDAVILDFFHDLESSLAATYVTAAGTFTTAEWRQRVMTWGSASAARVGVLANGGQGAAPTSATYPLSDLISADGYILSTPAKKTAG